MTDDLTPAESAILIVLMAEAREILNSELTARFQLDIRKSSRDKLNRLGLVASRREGRSYLHALDDKGWVRVQQELNFDSPRARALGAALSALHGNLRERVLPRTSFRNLGEMFTHAGDATTDESAGLDQRIRDAYAALAVEPGVWVSLARLRPLLADVPRGDLDEALEELIAAPDANIVPESNQKTLTAADRAAAVRIGGQEKHLLAIGV